MRRLTEEHTALPADGGSRWHASFRHLASYGGGYYTYLWARSLSRRVWRRAFQHDPFCARAGERWCESVLRHGGARDPRRMVHEMLAATPQADAAVGAGAEPQDGAEGSVGAAEKALLELVDLTSETVQYRRAGRLR